MRIWLFSDLHGERGDLDTDLVLRRSVEADVCVVPGDLDFGPVAMQRLAATVAQRMPVVYVPGNHDLRHPDPDAVLARMRMITNVHPNLHLLAPGAVVIDGVRFVGATLWTDYDLLGEEHREACMRAAASRFVGYGSPDVGPEWARRQHLEHLEHIVTVTETPHPGPTVVVTHHAPHRDCSHPRFGIGGDDPLKANYVSDLDQVIRRIAPDLWLHGHVHDGVDHMVGRTRVLANPMGYRVRIEKRKGEERVRYHSSWLGSEQEHDWSTVREGYENPVFDVAMVVDLPVPSDGSIPVPSYRRAM